MNRKSKTEIEIKKSKSDIRSQNQNKSESMHETEWTKTWDVCEIAKYNEKLNRRYEWMRGKMRSRAKNVEHGNRKQPTKWKHQNGNCKEWQ